MRIAVLTIKNLITNINFSEDISRMIEEDYVYERKSKKDFTQDQFKMVLTLTKYICLLEGNGSPDMESYKKAKELVFEMVRRNEARSQSAKKL